MSRLPTLAAAAVLGLAASACAPVNPELSPAYNPTLYSLHQPVVQRTDFVIDVRANGDSVPQSELQRLDAWFASIDARYGDRISIDEAPGYENPSARADVARVAANHGLLLAEGAPVLNSAVAPGTLRVIASRATASVPGCPDWSEDQVAPDVYTSSNFGCSTNSNLAAMIANPEDLLVGQNTEDPDSAGTAGRAIRVYRGRTPTGTQPLPSTTTSGRGN